jgi:His/Glu/Gln/Arg/opine family amino acid ABC transporter permease subunit
MIEILVNNYGVLIGGAVTTVVVSGLSIALGMGLGLALAFGLLSQRAPVAVLCGLYRSFWRGTPILVQLLIVFYLLPRVGLEVPPFVAALIALSLNTAAFQAEIYRAGLLAIPRGEIEAARLLGIRKWTIRRRILIPQMFRLVLPPLVNEAIIIVKNSSLVSVIAVTELMRRSQQIASTTFKPLEVYLIAGAIYLAINLLLAQAGRRMERHLAIEGARA